MSNDAVSKILSSEDHKNINGILQIKKDAEMSITPELMELINQRTIAEIGQQGGKCNRITKLIKKQKRKEEKGATRFRI